MSEQELRDKITAAIGQLRGELARNMAPSLQQKLSPEDVAQETCLRAIEKLDTFRYTSDAALLGWLRAIANRIVRSAFRKSVADPCQQVIDVLVQSGVTRPSQFVARAEAATAVEQALELLGSRHRRVIEMRHFQGLPFADIARVFSRNEAVVRGWHRNALEQLGRQLKSASRHFL